MRHPRLFAFVATALFTGIVCNASDGHAWNTRLTAVNCMPRLASSASAIKAIGAAITSTIATDGVNCGFPYSPTEFHYNVSTVNVYMRDNSSSLNATANACVTSLGAASDFCGLPSSTSGTGYQTIGIADLSYWTDLFTYGSWHAYVVVSVGTNFELRGINFSG